MWKLSSMSLLPSAPFFSTLTQALLHSVSGQLQLPVPRLCTHESFHCILILYHYQFYCCIEISYARGMIWQHSMAPGVFFFCLK